MKTRLNDVLSYYDDAIAYWTQAQIASTVTDMPSIQYAHRQPAQYDIPADYDGKGGATWTSSDEQFMLDHIWSRGRAILEEVITSTLSETK